MTRPVAMSTGRWLALVTIGPVLVVLATSVAARALVGLLAEVLR